MESFEPFVSLAVALAMGFVIGLERERAFGTSEPPPAGGPASSIGGVRTYALFSLAGALSMLVGRAVGTWFVGLVLAGMLTLAGVAYADDVRSGRDRGLTSESAFVITFLLGALALSEGVFASRSTRLVVVSALGVTVTTILSMKSPLHGFARKISRDDVYSTLKFLIVAVVVLPLLPNRTVDPLDAISPFHVGVLVVMIAGIGFTGYVAVRVLGPGRGLGLTGLVGGLASSTAVTLAMAARAKRDPEITEACALSTVLACSIMPARVLGIIAIIHPPLAWGLLAPLGAMFAGGLAASGALYMRSRRTHARSESMALSNPFELTSAVKFGALFALVLFLSKAANAYLGQSGSYVAGLLAGTTDVDAITLSMAQLAKGGVALDVAVLTIMLACASNTVVKLGLAVASGGAAFGVRVAVALVLSLATAALGLLPVL